MFVKTPGTSNECLLGLFIASVLKYIFSVLLIFFFFFSIVHCLSILVKKLMLNYYVGLNIMIRQLHKTGTEKKELISLGHDLKIKEG